MVVASVAFSRRILGTFFMDVSIYDRDFTIGKSEFRIRAGAQNPFDSALERPEMIKNFALACLAILILVLFNGYIKEGVFDARMSIMLARIEFDEESADLFADVLGRVGDGHRQRVFTQPERIALEELIAEIKTFQGKEMPEKTAENLSNRLQIITDRHGL